MKTIFFGIAMAAAFLAACGNNNKQSKEVTVKSVKIKETVIQENNANSQETAINEILKGYLQLKNALVNDDGKEAATAGKEITKAIHKVDEKLLTDEQRKIYDDVKDDVKEHAEHISANGDKIAHQREHFDILSKDMYDLVKVSHLNQTLFQDHCPMYNEGMGGNWLSELKEIKNPYLGKKMPACGEVKEELK